MKKFLFVFLLLISVTLTSCLSSKMGNARYYFERFEFLEPTINANGYDCDIVYDKETKVMYVVSRTGTFTVMVDENGKPLLYNENK